MNRQEAVVIYEQGQEAVVSKLLELSGKIEALEKQHRDTSDSAPFMLENRHSGMIPVYEKLPAKKRRRQPGRKAGHPMPMKRAGEYKADPGGSGVSPARTLFIFS